MITLSVIDGDAQGNIRVDAIYTVMSATESLVYQEGDPLPVVLALLPSAEARTELTAICDQLPVAIQATFAPSMPRFGISWIGAAQTWCEPSSPAPKSPPSLGRSSSKCSTRSTKPPRLRNSVSVVETPAGAVYRAALQTTFRMRLLSNSENYYLIRRGQLIRTAHQDAGNRRSPTAAALRSYVGKDRATACQFADRGADFDQAADPARRGLVDLPSARTQALRLLECAA